MFRSPFARLRSYSSSALKCHASWPDFLIYFSDCLPRDAQGREAVGFESSSRWMRRPADRERSMLYGTKRSPSYALPPRSTYSSPDADRRAQIKAGQTGIADAKATPDVRVARSRPPADRTAAGLAQAKRKLHRIWNVENGLGVVSLDTGKKAGEIEEDTLVRESKIREANDAKLDRAASTHDNRCHGQQI